MDRYGRITKCEKPLIYPNPDYTEHQRDPKLFAYKDRYYILMGAQNPEKKGVMLLYSANSPEGTWQFDGELKVRGYETFGFMCECPCIERIGDKWILLFSPQGIEAEGDLYQQKYNNVYFIGDFDPEKLEFIPDGPYQELDRGFDFYAAQCASQEVYRDAAVLIGWASCPDYTTPLTDEIGYSHIQTLPRLLTIEDGKLMQRPAPGMKSLEGDVLFKAENGTITADRLHGLMPRTAIIHLENPGLQSTELSLFSKNGRRGFEISYDRNAKVLTVDRSALNHQINEEFGAVRRIALENGLSALDVYVDRSSVEIFVNNGEKVVSARVFPEADERILRMGGKDINLSIYSPLKSVEDNFII
jgi:beta-fructofuranosidase